VDAKIGAISVVLQAGVPKVSMQRPWADSDHGVPTAANPKACSAARREIVMSWLPLF
jgi:hypothetical protein